MRRTYADYERSAQKQQHHSTSHCSRSFVVNVRTLDVSHFASIKSSVIFVYRIDNKDGTSFVSTLHVNFMQRLRLGILLKYSGWPFASIWFLLWCRSALCSGQIWVYGGRFLTSENTIKIYNVGSIGKLVLVLRGFSHRSSFRWKNYARKPTDCRQSEQLAASLSTSHLSCGLHVLKDV
jgi:hypothetical protein